MTVTASLSLRDLVRINAAFRDDLVQPAPALSDGADKTKTPLGPFWSDLFLRCAIVPVTMFPYWTDGVTRGS
jgi:hypothetical protein